ncbi:MAG TPA: protease modulator HflC [Opitutales bacterium]|nr:protease modulator HflC [Opitutales bacterium]
MSFKKDTKRGASAPFLVGGIVLLGVAIFVAVNSMFIVREWEQVVVTQFRKIKGDAIQEAGLHFKIPFIQEIHRFERRLVRWDGVPFTLYTADRRTIHVNVTARWRIEDAAVFFPRARTIENANTRLYQLINGALRNEIGQYDLFELVRSTNFILDETEISLQIDGEAPEEIDLEEIATLGREIRELPRDEAGNYLGGRPVVLEKILEEARKQVAEAVLGIHLEDILIKQLNYTQDIEANVYAQMNAELQKISAGFRSHGQKNAEQKLGEMEKELASIEGAAQERVARIKGRAEAEAIAIYADAFGRNPDFYRFLRTLETYGKTIGSNSSLIVSTDSALFGILKDPEAGVNAGEASSEKP